jgi:hypothetical protein
MAELEMIAPEGAPAGADPFKAPETPETESSDLASIIDRALDGAEEGETEARAARERDEKGRFKAKEPAASEEAPAAPADASAAADPAAKEPVTVRKAEAETVPAGETGAAPVSEGHFRGWSSDERARFNSLTKDAQDFVLARQKSLEGNYNRKLTEAGEFRKSVEPLASVTQEHADYFASLGAAPHEAIRNMVQVSRVLDQGTYAQKVQILQQLAHNYGLPFALQQAEDPHAPGGQRYAEIYDQRAELANTRAELERIRRAQEEASQHHYVSTVQAFASQTDAQGQPKYPFFEQVRGTMAQLMHKAAEQETGLTLEQAYAQASAPIQAAIEAERSRVKAETERVQREAAEKARRASPVRTSPAAPNGRTAPGSLNDLISGALDRAGIA